MSGKNLKIALVLVLLGTSAYLSYSYFARSGPLPNSVTVVCAVSGERLSISREALIEIPLMNKKIQQRSLFPYGTTSEGALRVSERYREVLQAMGDQNKFIDIETMTVKGK